VAAELQLSLVALQLGGHRIQKGLAPILRLWRGSEGDGKRSD